MSYLSSCPVCKSTISDFDFENKKQQTRCKNCNTLLQYRSIKPANELIGKEFKVLDKGFIRLVDVMGNDSAIVQAARVSYGKGTKTRHEDEGLIRYLMRHRHTTPFEQCELKFHIKVPMDCWRQWIRHRTASVNEYSTRYSEAIDDKQETAGDKWRLQDTKKNLQGSKEFLQKDDDDKTTGGSYYSVREKHFHENANEIYKERLNAGIAREQARKDLPLSTYTMAYWKIDLHNLLHFLSLRMDAHAQLEIRSYANIIGNEIVAKLFPLTWEAFRDYRLNAITLTARDILMIKRIASVKDALIIHGRTSTRILTSDEMDLNKMFGNEYSWFNTRKDGTLKNNLERMEFEEKAERLGIEIPWK